MKRVRTALPLIGGILVAGASVAQAAPFKDQLVQPPSIGQPERGSIAGSLSKLAFGPSALARGAYSLPLPIDLPSERGALLASVIPAYSAEGGVTEWGVGWQADLAIRRHRVIGEIDFTTNDGFTSPWGRLVAGDDGAYYPAGLRTMMRLTMNAGGWEALMGDGTKYFFDAADADTTVDGTYAWNLSRVETLYGDSTDLTWIKNDSGRAFLSEVKWGGRFDGTQYRMSLTYETLATPFATFVSGQKALLDRRVTRVTSSVWNGGGYVERWRHDLGYQTSPTGPAFYLTSVTKKFASGESEPPLTYQYDFSTDLLASAAFQDAPALDDYLGTYGSGAIQPDKASMTDLERNGLTDMEVHLDQTLVRQTDVGYVFEPLPAPTGGEDPLCRPAPSGTNKPRVLARMHGDAAEPNVVVTKPNSTGTQTRILVCDRAGFPVLDQWKAGAWAMGANTRLADVDLDHRPDLVRVYYGGAQVLRNTSASAEELSFAPGQTSTLMPKVTPTASWVLDFNGDHRPDLMVRHGGGAVVWRGVGFGRFESTGTSYLFTTASGQPLSGLSTYEFSHGDFNNDGLSDLILTKGQTVLLFHNRGSSFVEASVSAFASIPWSVSYPVVVDLSGSGNEQIVMADGTQAKVLQLSRPSTGLLLSSDDGKGTVVQFGYGRVAPAPGVNQLHSIITSMSTTSSGYDPVSYAYEYGAPVWHSEGKYLVGFEDARKASPFLEETVSFYNDDQIAGAVTGTLDEDARSPGLLRFSEREVELAAFHGVPWLRLVSVESGWRNTDGTATVSSRTDYLAYAQSGICPIVTETSGPAGVLREETTLVHAPGLDDELVCLGGAMRTMGSHADAALDFDYRFEFERDDLGRLVRAEQVAPDGTSVVAQEVSYGADNRIASVGSPGRGTSFFTYDPVTGQISSITSPDGVVESVAVRAPITDAIVQSRLSRGDAEWNRFSDHDGLERLRAGWDDLSGASPAQPLREIEYVWPTAAAPGRILERRLVDAFSGSVVETADIMAADGAVLAEAALQPEGWSISGLTQLDRTDLESRSYVRSPLASLAGLTNASLYDGATLLGATTKTGDGTPMSSWITVQTGVVTEDEVTREIVGDHLVVTATQNGTFVTKSAAGADGKARWFQDENGATMSYVYDAMGRLRRVETQQGVHSIDFDALGRATVVQREGVQRLEWSYHPITGQVTERREKSPGGQLDRTISYQYDAIGRTVATQETKAATGEVRTLQTHWDGAVPSGPALEGQLGFATGAQTDEISKVTKRTTDGKLASTRIDLDGWRTVTQDFEYHAGGAIERVVTGVADENGVPLLVTEKELFYDAYGRLSECHVDGAALYTVSYDAEGRAQAINFADGSVTLDHDAVTRARRGYAASGSVTGSMSWDKNDRGQTVTETFQLADDTVQRSYAYDARGYLTSSSDGTQPATYAYDASGLVTSASDELGERPVSRTPTTITAGEETYLLDGMGRIISHDDLTVVYGPSGNIEHATRGSDVMDYAYDEGGMRVLKYKNGAPVAAYVLGSYLDDSALVEPIDVAGVLVGVLVNGVFQRVLFDRRGTPLADDAGELAVASAYGARSEHGALAEAIDYVRKGYDKDLGLVRMGVRDYDPLLGQFWTPDPKFLGDLDLCVASPDECNLYGYAKNDPVSFVDPTGTDAKEQCTIDDDKAAALDATETYRSVTTRDASGKKYFGMHADGVRFDNKTSNQIDFNGQAPFITPNAFNANVPSGVGNPQTAELVVKSTHVFTFAHREGLLFKVDYVIHAFVETETRALIKDGKPYTPVVSRQTVTYLATQDGGGFKQAGDYVAPGMRHLVTGDVRSYVDESKFGTATATTGVSPKGDTVSTYVSFGHAAGARTNNSASVTAKLEYEGSGINVTGPTSSTVQATQGNTRTKQVHVNLFPKSGNAWNQ